MMRTPARRVQENDVQKEIPPQFEKAEQVPQCAQDDQVSIVGEGDDVPELSNKDIREAFLVLARAMTT